MAKIDRKYHSSFLINVSECYSTSNCDENQPSDDMKDTNQTAVMDKTVQQMTHGFVALFEKELDQVQYSLKEAL